MNEKTRQQKKNKQLQQKIREEIKNKYKLQIQFPATKCESLCMCVCLRECMLVCVNRCVLVLLCVFMWIRISKKKKQKNYIFKLYIYIKLCLKDEMYLVLNANEITVLSPLPYPPYTPPPRPLKVITIFVSSSQLYILYINVCALTLE